MRPQLRIQLTSLACIKFFTKANILSISKRLGPVFLRWSIIDILTLFFSIIVAKRHQYVRNNLIKLRKSYGKLSFTKKKRDALPKGDACADQKLSIFFVWPYRDIGQIDSRALSLHSTSPKSYPIILVFFS